MAESDSALVPLGRFSTICRLTIKALRHYDEIGLLKPMLVDPRSGYRYYRLDQVATADLIRTLRAAEMPLEEIGAIVRAPGSDAARRLLAHQRQRLLDRIAAQHTAIATLDRLVAGEAAPPQRYTIDAIFTPPQSLVSERLTILPADLGSAIGRAIAETRAFIARHEVQPAGMPVAIYHAGRPEDDAMAIEVGWPVVAPLPDEGRIGMGTLGGVSVARTTHRGPYDEISGAFAAIAEWIQRHGHETAGAPWETYLTGPSEASDPPQILTGVCWPIR